VIVHDHISVIIAWALFFHVFRSWFASPRSFRPRSLFSSGLFTLTRMFFTYAFLPSEALGTINKILPFIVTILLGKKGLYA
jgi:hypothetical protein